MNVLTWSGTDDCYTCDEAGAMAYAVTNSGHWWWRYIDAEAGWKRVVPDDVPEAHRRPLALAARLELAC